MSTGVPFNVVREAELKAVKKRRSHHDPEAINQNQLEQNLVGLALSGGGVRSASFALGVVQALDERGHFRDVDFLSTVSGGGYLGGYIAALALDSAIHRDTEADELRSNSAATGEAAPAQGSQAAVPSGSLSITPLVSPSNEPQNRRVRRLVYSGDYLRSALSFLNRYIFGLILVNIFAFSGILTVAAGFAWLFRLLDGVSVSSVLKIFGFGSDMTRAFFPAFVCGVLWILSWIMSYWSSVASTISRLLLGLLIACVLIAFAALLGTGDIGIADIAGLFGAQPDSGGINAVVDVMRIVIIAPLVVFLIPYLNPRRFLQSGLSPASVWERLTFKIVSFALLIGIPLLAFGYLARENVSGTNDRRDGTLRSSSEIKNWNDGHARFWQRVEGEADEAKTLLKSIRDPELLKKADGLKLEDLHVERPFDAMFQIDYNLPLDGEKSKDRLVREFRKQLAGASGTEFLSHAIWTARGTIDGAQSRHPDLRIPQTIDGIVEILAQNRLARDVRGARWNKNAIQKYLGDDANRVLALPAAVGIAGSSATPAFLPSNELLRDVLLERIDSFNTLNDLANSKWYSPYLLAVEDIVSRFNTAENEPEEIVRLHRLQMDIEVLRSMMLENLNAGIRNRRLETQLPSDEDIQNNARLLILPSAEKTRIAELRRRIQSLQRLDAGPRIQASVTRENRKLIQAVYPNALAEEREIFRWGVLADDQAYRAQFLFNTALVFLISGFLVNLKATSPHGYYRSQLHATWLSDQRAFRDDVRLSQVNTTSEGYPYHLIVATANYLRASDDDKHRGATDLFLLSRLYCGSDRTGYQATNDYAGGTYDLASAIAVSAGALSPSQIKNQFVAAMAVLLNLRLGEWLPNPGYRPRYFRRLRRLLLRWPAPFFVAPSVLRTGRLETRGFCFVSDGGHFENLGMAPLLKRRCRVIICVDAGHDPDFLFQDFAALERRMRVDEGIVFSTVDSEKPPDDGGTAVNLNSLVPNRYQGRKTEPPTGAAPGEQGSTLESKRRSVAQLVSEAHFAVFKIWYPPGDSGPIPPIGFCIYIKPTFTGNEDLDLLSYASQNREFPHDSTADQFYEPDKFESYRQLGYHTGISVSDEADGGAPLSGKLRDWRRPSEAVANAVSPLPVPPAGEEQPESGIVQQRLTALAALDTPAESVVEFSRLLVDCLERGELNPQQRDAFRRSVNSQCRRFLQDRRWETLDHLTNVLKALGRGVRRALQGLFCERLAPPELRRVAGEMLLHVRITRNAKSRRALETVVNDADAPGDVRSMAGQLLAQVASDGGETGA